MWIYVCQDHWVATGYHLSLSLACLKLALSLILKRLRFLYRKSSVFYDFSNFLRQLFGSTSRALTAFRQQVSGCLVQAEWIVKLFYDQISKLFSSKRESWKSEIERGIQRRNISEQFLEFWMSLHSHTVLTPNLQHVRKDPNPNANGNPHFPYF
jgi:hypothetical protein